jgi:hypothetical protein
MQSQASDVALFDLVHELIQEEEMPERRSAQRHAYNCIQLLAPYDGERLPTQADFQHVSCLDLSSTGFSFCTRSRPESKFVIIALGEVPFLFFVAEILHVNAVNKDGMLNHHVGCRLLRRIERKQDANGG